jgi:hypothetical protein
MVLDPINLMNKLIGARKPVIWQRTPANNKKPT